DAWQSLDPAFKAAETMGNGVGQATEGAWNALAHNKDLQKGVEFGVKAAGLVTLDVSIIVALDVGLAYVPNKWIRTLQTIPAGNFAFSRSTNMIVATWNVASAGNKATHLSNQIQSIHSRIYKKP
ncbi:MAG: hypothetical protein P8X80_07925, partial [Desulfobacterales bacterium]